VSQPRRIIVIGGVAAGMSAASQVRRRDPEARVMVLERGNEISYGACGMPYNLADSSRQMDDLIVLTPEAAREDRGIDLRLRHEVEEIDINSSSVKVRNLDQDTTERHAFDALVIATGARAQRLRLPGFDLPGVVTLRSLEDGRAIDRLLSSGPNNATIIGAGYIGMEMAHVLTELGLAPQLAQEAPRA
jgi:NADPH-dependent 2,4-dienoyl-CoA reductase/sulfur reductase-like enzyme